MGGAVLLRERLTGRMQGTVLALLAALAMQPAVSAGQQAVIDAARLQAAYDTSTRRVRDTELEAHLAQIVTRLTQANPQMATLPVRVHVLAERLPYAFCLDNGTAYVSTGLIARLGSDAQLAALLAVEVAGVIRADKSVFERAQRGWVLANLLPDVVLETLTAGAANAAIEDAKDRHARALRRRLQMQSDAVAMQWLVRAGYDPQEASHAVLRLLDSLGREQRFGKADLNSTEGLKARLASLESVQPPVVVEVSDPPQAAAAEWWRATARRFALDVAREDVERGDSVALVALLQGIDAIDGPGGETAFFRARDLQRRAPGPAQLAEVQGAYERCVAYPDAPPEAFRELGLVYRRGGDSVRARAAFEQYLQRAPQAADAPIVRGLLETLR
jgi:hypothetical protein